MEMQEKIDIIENNLLLKLQSGSHLYGLDTPESDLDILGVIYEPFKYKVGFNTFNELDVSFKDKLDNGRNSNDAIDEKYYSLTRFVKLLITNNPTIIELLFSRNNIYIDPIIKKLYENRHWFLSKTKTHKAFIGYAISQEKKMEIKSENLFKINEFYELMKQVDETKPFNLIQEMSNNSIFSEYLKDYMEQQKDLNEKIEKSGSKIEKKSLENKLGKLMLGSIEFSVYQMFKKVKKQIKQIQDNKSWRSEEVKRVGHCPKFASHYLRLLEEGIELLTTGEIKFPLRGTDYLMEVKLGNWNLERVIQKGKELKEELDLLIKEDNVVLTDKTNIGKIEEILLDFYKEKYLEEFNS